MTLLDPPTMENGEEPQDATDRKPRKGWLLPALTIGCAVLAIGCLVLGLFGQSLLQPAEAMPERVAPEEENLPPQDESPDPTMPALGQDDGELIVYELADPAWVAQIASKTGIPERAMAAYAGAALWASAEFPSCGLGWNTLAAIGLVESEHGSIDGGSIGNDGIASPEIIGIPLDGTSTDSIPDTDGGALDGDSEWDRAVGPMQFIPATWQQHGMDGNGDGVADPHNIDDAAVSAAAYLCSSGGDLTQPENWIVAVEAYNSSVEYNNRVAEAANQYAAAQ
ncbi:lytic transglycosylase domain-containing protein [Gulosibacter sp. 10]|uniref:lytic transglycosylase domain-containing protein n=1 Tax=Gulosibacter sp. 10 TaxID=1255570 RepID=UPI00097F1A89|nr:lytic murein transglycosylase [Gulosibacter sp. 10]SJM54320.1 similar to membrane-bound lytic murein transglycosylase B [Gulosibacter sp. 10]